MVIRKALEKDAESIVNININGWQETYYGIFPTEFLKSLSSIKEENIKKCLSISLPSTSLPNCFNIIAKALIPVPLIPIK